MIGTKDLEPGRKSRKLQQKKYYQNNAISALEDKQEKPKMILKFLYEPLIRSYEYL